MKNFYKTANSQYGSSWRIDNTRPQQLNPPGAIHPPYEETVDAIPHYKRADKIIKNHLINQTRPTTSDSSHKTLKEFPYKSESYKYPEHGLKVGSPIYRTSNMTYGALQPTTFEIPKEFHPNNNAFTTHFNGHTYSFSGLNTNKTFSKVHPSLEEY